MHHPAYIAVRFYPPNMGNPVEVCLNLDDYTAKCYEPLPRDRELYNMPVIGAAFTVTDRKIVIRQLKDRAKLAEYLVPIITHALVEAITRQDAINGYTQDELARP